MRKTKIRAFIAGVVTILVLVVFLGVISRVMELGIPVFDNIGAALGF